MNVNFDTINLEENFPYSGYTEKQLKDIIGAISNKLAFEENDINVLKAVHYSSVAVNELNHRKYTEQIELLKRQLETAKNNSKSSTKFAYIAIGISVILGIFSTLTFFGVTLQSEEKQLYTKLIQMQEQELIKEDETIKNLNRIYIELHSYHLREQLLSQNKVSDKLP